MMMGWDEILQADIPSDAIVLSWQGIAGAIEGAKRGNKVVLSPNTHCYFDFYQSKDVQFEPFAIGGYTPVEKVYSFEPVPSELDEEQAKLVIGAQCNLWTEYINIWNFHVLPPCVKCNGPSPSTKTMSRLKSVSLQCLQYMINMATTMPNISAT